MKKLIYKLQINRFFCNALFGALMLLVLSGSSRIAHPDPILVFKKVANRLNLLKAIKYHYIREFNYPAENYLAKSEADIYIEFDKVNEVAGFIYQYRYTGGFSIFNNSEVFTADLKAKTLNVAHKVKLSNLEGKSALYNSIPTLRNILPLIIEDENIPKIAGDTLINNRTYHLLEFVLQNKTLNYTGTGFTPTTMTLTFYHKLIVDKTTSLPIALLQTKKGSKDLNRTDFIDIDTQPTQPSEKSWYYSSYLNEYKLDQAKPIAIIAPGQNAPEWQLTNYSSKAKETLEQYKGKVVMLEFWIRHCGYCIEAVPQLNQLNQKYSSDKFKLLAVNTEASRENIDLFVAKHPINYTIMYGDNPEVNQNYGISAFPQVVLLDKAGKVIYSGGIDMKKLIHLIDNNL